MISFSKVVDNYVYLCCGGLDGFFCIFKICVDTGVDLVLFERISLNGITSISWIDCDDILFGTAQGEVVKLDSEIGFRKISRDVVYLLFNS